MRFEALQLRFDLPERTNATTFKYLREAQQVIGHYCRMSVAPDVGWMTYGERCAATISWFTRQNGRWSKGQIRRLAASLSQHVGYLHDLEQIDEWQCERLLQDLRIKRPEPAKKRVKNGYAKTVKPADLRRLIADFRSQDDEFDRWIAGYLMIASRLGWRPGEILGLRREGRSLSAKAEKNTNGRGLCDTCLVGIENYPPHMIVVVDDWIFEISRWTQKYGGRKNLQSVMLKRLGRACEKMKIKKINLYTLRHFAISCLKRSGFSREEIAILVNHATTRTATERYGKARSGIRRAKKMLKVPVERLALPLRDKARDFRPWQRDEMSIKK